jgi:hypothetical protein
MVVSDPVQVEPLAQRSCLAAQAHRCHVSMVGSYPVQVDSGSSEQAWSVLAWSVPALFLTLEKQAPEEQVGAPP